MADKNQYIVNTADLVSVADTIRTKAGTSADLVFPDEFISTINNIPSGQTIPELSDMDNLFQKRDELIPLLLPAFNSIDSANYAFADNPYLTSVDVSNIKFSVVGTKNMHLNYMFKNCTRLNSVKLFNTIGSEEGQEYTGSIIGMFDGCSTIEEINMSHFKYAANDNYSSFTETFKNCTNLKRVALPVPYGARYIGQYAFLNCSSLEEVIMIMDSGQTWDIAQNAVNTVFSGSSIASLNCSIYVSDDVYDSFIASTRWEPYLSIIKKISEYSGTHWWEN